MEKKEAVLKSLGAKIRYTRLKANMTQIQLAHLINKDQQSIQRLEGGKVNPSYYFLLEIAEGLQVSLVELLR